MSLSRLTSLRKVRSAEGNSVYVKNLVVGNDLFAYRLIQKLENLDPGNNVFLSHRKNTLEKVHLRRPSLLRGEHNVNLVKAMHPEMEVSLNGESQFYKDQQFNLFTSRFKSYEILPGEDFFINERAELSKDFWNEFYPSKDEITQLYEKNFFEKYIVKIKKVDSDDLVSPHYWEISCGDGELLKVKNLFWGEGFSMFYDLLDNKSSLNDETIEAFSGDDDSCVLYVAFELDLELSGIPSNTLFIPQSQTHDWGHFIVEFTESDGITMLEAISFVKKDETTEEDLTRKIRLLKKLLDKSFPEFTHEKAREYISLFNQSSSASSERIKEEFMPNNFFTFGMSTPVIEESIPEEIDELVSSEISHFARAHLSVNVLPYSEL